MFNDGSEKTFWGNFELVTPGAFVGDSVGFHAFRSFDGSLIGSVVDISVGDSDDKIVGFLEFKRNVPDLNGFLLGMTLGPAVGTSVG